MMWGWTMCSFQRHQCLLLFCGIMQHSFIHHSNNNDICQEANETFPKENWYPASLKYGTVPESCFGSARLVLASSFLNSFPLLSVDLDSCQKTVTSLKHK
uniref:Secreted protein n=1 Tax=Micrurus spixii TaxID=129469 RepID=A0A2D4MQK3_9SAUR